MEVELVVLADRMTSQSRPFRWSARFLFAESSGPRKAGAAPSPACRPPVAPSVPLQGCLSGGPAHMGWVRECRVQARLGPET